MTKKAAQKKAAAKKPEAKAAPPAAPKKHERKIKPSEADKIERGLKMAASYLTQRDGMDGQLALDVVSTMSDDDVLALIAEANTAVIEKTPTEEAASSGNLVPDDEDAGKVFIDFLTVPLLAEHEEFVKWVTDAAAAAKLKNEAEKEYKALKAKIVTVMKQSQHDLVSCLGIPLERYTGHAISLDKIKLLEAGVSIDDINKGYKDTPYDDVRFGKAPQ